MPAPAFLVDMNLPASVARVLTAAGFPTAHVRGGGSDAASAPTGFVEALTIQLAGIAEVRAGPSLSGTLQEKLAQMREPLRVAQGKAGLWVERVPRDSDGQTAEFLVYIATRREDSVLVQVVRLPGPESSETERAVALKVREVLESVLAEPEPSLVRGVQLAPPHAHREAARSAAPPAGRGATVEPLIDVALHGVSGGNGSGSARLGAFGGGGVRAAGASWQIEALGRIGTTGGTAASAPDGTIETRDVLIAAEVRGLFPSSSFAAGAFLRGGGRLVGVRGETLDGQSGEATRFVPALAFGPEVRLLFGPVALRAALGPELVLRRQKFAVRGQAVADSGTWRGGAELGVALAFD